MFRRLGEKQRTKNEMASKESTIFLETLINAPILVVFDCARSIDVHQLSTAKTKEKAVAGRMSGLCELGDEVTWRAKHFGVYQTLSSRITKLKAPFYFQDCMLKGAFSYFTHDHFFEEKYGVTTMKDVFVYGVPYGVFGKYFDRLVLKKYMTSFLTERNRVIKELAELTLSKKFEDEY